MVGNVGGLIGNVNVNGVKIKNCYSVGKSIGNSALCKSGVECTAENCFYLLGSYQYASHGKATYTGVTAKSEEYMKSNEFLTVLNSGEDNWTRDNDINEGYPILKGIKYR